MPAAPPKMPARPSFFPCQTIDTGTNRRQGGPARGTTGAADAGTMTHRPSDQQTKRPTNHRAPGFAVLC